MKHEAGKIFKAWVLEALYSKIKGVEFIQLVAMSHLIASNRGLAVETWDSC